MRKLLAIAGLLVLTSCATFQKQQKSIWSQKMVESHGLGDFYCNRHHQDSLHTTGWDYVAGLVAHSVLQTWEQYPQKTAYYDAVKAFADKNLNEDGSMIINSKGETALRPSNIDDLPAGRIYFTLYEQELKKGNHKDAARYKKATDIIRNTLKYDHSRIANGLPGAGGFFHKAIYPNQMWLDGLYMGSPIYAQWQFHNGVNNAIDNEESWNDIAHQFKTVHKYTYDAGKQLNYHAWSATPNEANSFWANEKGPFVGASKEFWARGMGWYIAALADVLEYMPKEHNEYNAILQIYQQVVAGLTRWQDKESGLWYQLLQYDDKVSADGRGDIIDDKTFNVGTQKNYLESSASSIFTYGIFKGLRLGLIDRATYLPVAENAYQGLLRTFVKQRANGKVDIGQVCASAGLGPAKDPSRTGTINYYLAGKDVTIVENEGKAIGSFILASVEYEKFHQ